MATQPIINRTVTLNIISLVDYCYRKGIEDAYRIGDEGLAREFIDKTSQTGVYGFLNENGITMGWKEWTLRLMAQSRMTSWNGAMTRYFSMMGNHVNQNYLGCFVPISHRFYVMGVEHYTDAPNGSDFQIFQGKTRVFWTKKGLQNVNNRRYIDEIQMCAFDLERRDAEVWENTTKYDAKKLGAITGTQYEWFRRAVGLALTSRKD